MTVVVLRRNGIAQDGRQVCRLYPLGRGMPGGRWLYAVGYKDGRAKLGVARNPRQRMLQHWIASDGGIAWTHVFSRHADHLAAVIERRAIVLASEIGVRIRRTETFRGLDRDAAIRCVRAAIAERVVDARDRLLEIV